jgi:alkanesulfonate monooxygenase SsuD/methylene tetrahydromethanopterin reductase-like flavin-dependent oxidoreductase (luciferase family)
VELRLLRDALAPRSAVTGRDADLDRLAAASARPRTVAVGASAWAIRSPTLARHLNIICDPGECPRKLAALEQRCAEAGRDRSELETSFLAFVMMDDDGDRARAQQRDDLRRVGVDLDAAEPEQQAAITARHFVGTPDEVVEDLHRRVLDKGVDGLIINMVTNGHVPGTIERAGRALRPLVGNGVPDNADE